MSDFPTRKIYGDHHVIDVWPLNTDRAIAIPLSGGVSFSHLFADGTEMAFIHVPLGDDGSVIFVHATRGDDPTKSFPLASGYWPWNVVGDPRVATFKLPTGSATITVMEA